MGVDGDALFVRQPNPPELANLFDTFARARQLVAPGGPWTYCNAGFSLAGHLVEVLRGKPYDTVLRERILAPLGMKRTCTRADDAIFHRVAMRHLSLPGRDPIPLPGGGWQRGWELAPIDTPAGGIVSSASDLLRWLRFWLGRADDSATDPLAADLRACACEDQLPPWNPSSGQGLGWAVRNDPAARVLNHGGLSAGYCSYTLFVPALDLAMVVLTNSTSGALVHTELTRWLVGEVGGRVWSDPAPLATQPAFAPYTGAYWGSFGTTRVDGGRRRARARDRAPPDRRRLVAAAAGSAAARPPVQPDARHRGRPGGEPRSARRLRLGIGAARVAPHRRADLGAHLGRARVSRAAAIQAEFAAEHARRWQDADAARSYASRPPYPDETFDILVALIADEPRHVLDVGCGTGKIARKLAARVARVDAVDLAAEMVEAGRARPGGDAANLRWSVGRAEDTPFEPPYALVVGGESLHWMDFEVVLPRFARALTANGVLAAVYPDDSAPAPWRDDLAAIIKRHSTAKDYAPFDMFGAWEAAGLFRKLGRRTTAPIEFAQSVEAFIDSHHARSTLTRAHIDAERFDREVRDLLAPHCPDGILRRPIRGQIDWGRPLVG